MKHFSSYIKLGIQKAKEECQNSVMLKAAFSNSGEQSQM